MLAHEFVCLACSRRFTPRHPRCECGEIIYPNSKGELKAVCSICASRRVLIRLCAWCFEPLGAEEHINSQFHAPCRALSTQAYRRAKRLRAPPGPSCQRCAMPGIGRRSKWCDDCKKYLHMVRQRPRNEVHKRRRAERIPKDCGYCSKQLEEDRMLNRRYHRTCVRDKNKVYLERWKAQNAVGTPVRRTSEVRAVAVELRTP